MFDPRTELPDAKVQTFDPFRGINHGNEPRNYGAKARKTAQNYENYRNWNGDGVQFRAGHGEEDESGVCSPPLWKSNSPPKSFSNYRALSPNSRAQAIARGQWELMEMVKNMPESCYELSLKDIVEQPKIQAQDEKVLMKDQGYGSQRMKIKRQGSKESERRANMMGNGNVHNGGLFLKTVVPFALRSKKKKKKKNPYATSGSTCGSKVSPKPEASSDKSVVKAAEKDWWKKRFSGSTDSDGGRTSSNSGSTRSSGSSGSSSRSSSRCNSTRKRKCLLASCWTFLPSRKSKSTE